MLLNSGDQTKLFFTVLCSDFSSGNAGKLGEIAIYDSRSGYSKRKLMNAHLKEKC